MHPSKYSAEEDRQLPETRGLPTGERIEYEHGAPDWRTADRHLRRIAQSKAGLDFEAAIWILAALRAGTARKLGIRSNAEYVSRVLQCGRREASERVRVAKALAKLPRLAEALRDAELGWSAARELSRILVGETEQAWLDAVAGKTVREIEVMVAGLKKGDLPTAPKSTEARDVWLSFRVSVATATLLRDALEALRSEAGGLLSDDEALTRLARTVLEEPRSPGRASPQLAVDQKAKGTSRGESAPTNESVATSAGDFEVVEPCSVSERAPEVSRRPQSAGAPERDGARTERARSRGGARPIATAPHVRATATKANARPRTTQTVLPPRHRSVLRHDRGRSSSAAATTRRTSPPATSRRTPMAGRPPPKRSRGPAGPTRPRSRRDASPSRGARRPASSSGTARPKTPRSRSCAR